MNKYAVKKGKKYMSGHSYTNMMGHSFRWTINKENAIKLSQDIAKHFASMANAKIESF
jgi:adenosine/AMP kinase